MPKMDPEAAAAYATGDGDEDGLDDLPDAGGTSSGGPMDRLFDGNAPGPSVGEFTAEYGMPHWMAITARGVMRVATGDGIPPIFEIVTGSVLGVLNYQGGENPDNGGGGSAGPPADNGGGDGPAIEEVDVGP